MQPVVLNMELGLLCESDIWKCFWKYLMQNYMYVRCVRYDCGSSVLDTDVGLDVHGTDDCLVV